MARTARFVKEFFLSKRSRIKVDEKRMQRKKSSGIRIASGAQRAPDIHDNVIDDKNKSYTNTRQLTVDTTLTLCVPTDFKRLATFDFVHARALARVAGKFQDDLLRGLCFFVKHWFGLTPVTRLFSVVTAFTCR